MIKPIETIYKGFRFRSRLEARWAVFFDALGLSWEYEKEGYEIDNYKYLPDFYLNDFDTHIEIKPTMPSKNELDKLCIYNNEFRKNNMRFYIIIGNPYVNGIENDYLKEYYAVEFINGKEYVNNYTCFIICLNCNRPILTEYYNDNIYAQGYYNCIYCDVIDRNTEGIEDIVWFHKGDWITNEFVLLYGRMYECYKRARSARFEHGAK